VQYTANVVNIVLPEFGTQYLNDDHAFEFQQITQKFYRHFEDTYDTIAVIPQQTFLPSYGAFHRNVQNQVHGIGLQLFDISAAYGSQTHRLKSVELFATGPTEQASTSHELAHQWADFIDWARLTGISRAGHQPESHDPLWFSGETLVGGVLRATRRVRQRDDGWEIERTPGPARFHPFTRYAMGLIGRDEVPEITLFDDQGQFNPTTLSEPEPGRPVMGSTRTATVFNVVGMLGDRRGPALQEWQRATVVVSRERLLSQREMDYWTFFMQRLDDPRKTGLVGYDGLGSFEVATGSGNVDLHTDIRPIGVPPIAQALDVDAREFGRRDWRDVVFDAAVPSRYRVGSRVRWSGAVNAPDRSDINEILIRLWRSGGTTDDAIRVFAPVSSASTFIAETEFNASQRGVYLMEVFLFWPGSGSQVSRTSVSAVTIE
jgi:hypothetical protein